MLVKSQSIMLGTPFAGTATLPLLCRGTQKEVSFISRGPKTSSLNKSSKLGANDVSWITGSKFWLVNVGPSSLAARAVAHPNKLKPVLLYSGRVHGSNAKGLEAIALRISSLVHSFDPFDRSDDLGSQNAGALISTSSWILDF